MFRRLHCGGHAESQAYRLLVVNQVFVVRSSRLSQDGQHSSGISSSCGRTIMYPWDSLSSLPQSSLRWCSDVHQIASLENSMLRVLLRSQFELLALSVPGLKDALVPCAVGGRLTVFDAELLYDFNFATTRSSSPGFAPCISLYDMTWGLLLGLKNGCKRTSKSAWCSTCQRVGFWCPHIWCGFVDPHRFNQSINQAQPCGFGTRVSSSDFCLFTKSSWFPLRCLQKCEAKRRSEKVLRLWLRDPHWIIIQYHLGWGVSSSWCWCVSSKLRLQRVSPCRNVMRKRSSAGIPSMRRPASKEITSDSLELGETEVCFFYIPTYGNECSTSKDTIHPEVDFESSRSPAKSESWNNPNRQCCAVIPWQYCRLTCVMNACNQTSQAFGTSARPFCDCSCQFMDGPKNVWSTNACLKQAFEDSLRAYFWQFSHRLCFFLFWNDGRQNMVYTTVFIRHSQHLATHFFAWRSMSKDQAIAFACDFSQPK